jgi:abortive infection bacteriophage resistance protein
MRSFLKAESFTLKLKRKKKFVKVFSLSHTLRPIIYRNNESSKKKKSSNYFLSPLSTFAAPVKRSIQREEGGCLLWNSPNDGKIKPQNILATVITFH